jgi:hypothetical protein
VKTSQDRQQQIRRERVEAMIDGRIAALFGRAPMLCGFYVPADLQVTEVSVYTWPGYVAGEELYSEIVTALADLVDERPEAVELLRGRTFARAIQ